MVHNSFSVQLIHPPATKMLFSYSPFPFLPPKGCSLHQAWSVNTVE